MPKPDKPQRCEVPTVDNKRLEQIRKQLPLFEPTGKIDRELVHRLARAGAGGSY